MKRQHISILILFLSLLPSLAGPAHAQSILDIFKKKLPDIQYMPETEFEEKTELHKDTPSGNRLLAYEIRAPKDWSLSEDVSLGSFVVDDKILSTLAKFYGPAVTAGKHYMLIQTVGLEYQMTAKNWIMQYLIENNYNVQGIKVHDPKKVEAVYIFVDNENQTYVTRSIAQINGKNLVFIQFFLPIEDFKPNKIMQAQVLNSFKLTNPSEELIENFKTHKFIDIAEVQYPETWELKAPAVRSVDRINASISNLDTKGAGRKRGILVGRIDFDLVSVYDMEDIETEIDNYQKTLAKRGVFIREELEDQNDFVFDDPEEIAETHVYKVIDKDISVQDYEFWLTIRAFGDYFYFTSLLTPTRESDFFTWARNTQAFKEVVQRFKEQEGSRASE